MTSQPIPIRIPLLGISGIVEQKGQAQGLPQGLKRVSEFEIPEAQDLPEHCYAMEVPNILRESVGEANSLGIFSFEQDVIALNDMYALGLAGREPVVCKVIKMDARTDPSSPGETSQSIPSSRTRGRRKSFMTPTPLHIPDSQVSPIPDSAHEMIYLKDLNEKEGLKVVPLREVVWMHPLIIVKQNPEG
jgi:hypothetical protein